MGYEKGMPDLAIFEPRGAFHGLFVELKRTRGGTVSVDQRIMMARLRDRGYQVAVCKGATEAIDTITAYLCSETGELSE